MLWYEKGCVTEVATAGHRHWHSGGYNTKTRGLSNKHFYLPVILGCLIIFSATDVWRMETSFNESCVILAKSGAE